MLLPIILTFVLAFAVFLLKPLKHSKFFKFLSLYPFLLFVYLLSYIPAIRTGKKALLYKNEWIPSLGISLDFKIDGLSLLFALMITGIGTLIYVYAASYLKKDPYIQRFFAYLTLFMGAMLGVVLSDNLITLFIFWELTSISSFFLIGFNNESSESRSSALWALSITGLGGFFLLTAFVVIGYITNTYSIHELLQNPDVLINNSHYYIIIGFLFMGAFTKSAQFPFYFWLPGAMKAPTPVSAYLHSATMVKAGIYILARFNPMLNDGIYWSYILMGVGGVTMLIGSFTSIYKKDMKSVLAFSTISALGIIVFLIGIGTEMAIYAACTFILVHALYKATLFLITGIVDHQAKSRDISFLRGLGKKMPIVAIASVVAALSSAGIPLTFGFISKELIYGATMDSLWSMETYIGLTIMALLTNIFLTTSGFLVGIKPFFGEIPKKLEKVKMPSISLWIPPVILSVFTLLFGIFPFIADKSIIRSVVHTVYGAKSSLYLSLWHGFNLVFVASLITIALGTSLYFFIRPSNHLESRINAFNSIAPKAIMINIAEKIRSFAFIYTRFFHNGYLRIYLMFIIIFFTGIVGFKLFSDVPLRINTEHLSEFRIYEFVVFVIILVAVYLITNTTSRLTAIAGLGVVGYAICLIFVFYGAPDLAMTQFAIDTLTVVLFVLVLFKLPAFLKFSDKKIQFRDGVVSIAFGALISAITLQALVYPSDKDISKFYADNAYLLAKGKNVVNVILVDYRGIDTLIETIVLSIAAIGVYSILKYKLEDGEKTE